jgi:UDP-N-acetylglucosamine 2-epimerase (non-hydrolysing)
MHAWPRTIVVVHGDTLSSLIGTITSRLAGIKVVHIEAGLRTFRILDPFPEEIIRRLTSKLAHFHLAPSIEARENLLAARVNPYVIQVTEGNTALDNLQSYKRSKKKSIPTIPVIVVTLHRHELLKNRKLLFETLTFINEISERFSVFLYLDARLDSWIKKSQFSLRTGVQRREKSSHTNFLNSLMSADLVITDSGGLQEELAYFGIPGIIHRRSTERHDGLGENLALSNWEVSNLEVFVQEYFKYQRSQKAFLESPSDKVVTALMSWELI